MKIKLLASLFALSLFIPHSASADIVRVFDLPLGGKLDRKLPRCNKSEKPNSDFCRPERAISPKVKNKVYKVVQPPNALPEWVVPGLMTLVIGKTGKLDSIAVAVLAANETLAIDSISRRFGAPTNAIASRSGMRVTVWRYPSLSIELLCEYDDCIANFLSPAGATSRTTADVIKRPLPFMP